MRLIVLYPFLMLSQQDHLSSRMPLGQVMEQFTIIDPQASDDEYRDLIVQLGRNGTSLANGIRRQIRQFGENALTRLTAEAGLSNTDMREINVWIRRMRERNDHHGVQNDACDVLGGDLNNYIEELFTRKQCKGRLRIRHASDSPSLIGLGDDIEVHMKKNLPRILSGYYSEHVLTINDQFKDLDPDVQRAFMHFFISKIAVDHALFNVVTRKIIEKKRSSIGLKAILQSAAADDYREYVMMQAFAHCVLDDSQLAQPLSDIFDLYGPQHEFYTKHARSRNWLQRIRRFMSVDTTK